MGCFTHGTCVISYSPLPRGCHLREVSFLPTSQGQSHCSKGVIPDGNSQQDHLRIDRPSLAVSHLFLVPQVPV